MIGQVNDCAVAGTRPAGRLCQVTVLPATIPLGIVLPDDASWDGGMWRRRVLCRRGVTVRSVTGSFRGTLVGWDVAQDDTVVGHVAEADGTVRRWLAAGLVAVTGQPAL